MRHASLWTNAGWLTASLGVAVFLMSASKAPAIDWSTWQSDTGLWTDSSKWLVPSGGANSGVLVKSGTVTIDSTVNTTVDNVLVGWSGNGAVNMTGGSLSIVGASGDPAGPLALSIGESGVATFRQSGGLVATNVATFNRGTSDAKGTYYLDGGILKADRSCHWCREL